MAAARSNILHHVRVEGCNPQRVRESILHEKRLWLLNNPKPWTAAEMQHYNQRFSLQIEEWLDRKAGSCPFRDAAARDIVQRQLMYFEQVRFQHVSWVIMPNHIHTLTYLYSSWPLEKVVASWKKGSARELNALSGREGALWQKDYFDTIIRDELHLHRCIRYIRNNPLKAKLRSTEYLVYESSYSSAVDS